MEHLTRRCGRARLVCMTKWEYFTAPLMVHNTKAILDNFGKQGWELVQVVSMPAAGGLAIWRLDEYILGILFAIGLQSQPDE